MKKIVKYKMFLMVLVMVFTLAGCGGGGAKESASKNGTGEDIWDKYPAFDMEQRVIKIASHYDLGYNTPVAEFSPEDKQKEAYRMQYYENLKRVAEKYNVQLKVVVVPWDRMIPTLTASVLSGEPFVDIVHLGADNYYSIAAGGYLQPVSEYTNDKSDVNTNQQALFKLPPVKGSESCAVARNVSTAYTSFLGFNTKIFNSLGVETPLSLYKKDEWTWDNFLKLAKLTTKDTNGDGKNDYWGYSGYNIANILMPTNDASIVDTANKKELFTSKNTIETIDFSKKFYQEKCVYMLGNDPFNFQNTDLFREGTTAMFSLSGWFICNSEKTVEFDFQTVPFPKGPSNTSGNVMMAAPEAFAIPNGVKDADKVYQIFEELHLWFNNDHGIVEQDTLNYLETGLQTQENIDLVLDIAPKWFVDYSFSVPEIDGIWYKICKDAIEGKSVSTLVESNKNVAQDLINQFFG